MSGKVNWCVSFKTLSNLLFGDIWLRNKNVHDILLRDLVVDDIMSSWEFREAKSNRLCKGYSWMYNKSKSTPMLKMLKNCQICYEYWIYKIQK